MIFTGKSLISFTNDLYSKIKFVINKYSQIDLTWPDDSEICQSIEFYSNIDSETINIDLTFYVITTEDGRALLTEDNLIIEVE